MFVHRAVAKFVNGWLNKAAPLNMYSILATLETSKVLPNGWLNAAAFWNIPMQL